MTEGSRLAQDHVDQHGLLRRREEHLLREQLSIAAVEEVLDHVAAHLVRRVPARADRHVGHARIEHVVGPVPPDRVAQLDGGARAKRLVARRVRAVVEHAVLHVDQAGEGEVGKHLAPVRRVLHEPQEHAVRAEHVAALHQREPVVEALPDGAVEVLGLLVGPVPLGPRGLLVHLDLVEARVVARRSAEELVPRIEPRRHVPDHLGQRQIPELRRDHRPEGQAHALAEQAVVIVHELDHAVVEALVIRHVGVGRVDPDRLAQDLGDRATLLEELVEHPARADLVTLDDAVLQAGILGGGHLLIRGRGRDRHGVVASRNGYAAGSIRYLTLPAVRPPTRCRSISANRITTGTSAMTDAANSRSQCCT